jgi:transcriptional regulator with XRE-family HTH domain
MSTPRSTTERINRKGISEELLAEVLGLDESWIDRLEENGVLREKSYALDQLPEFIRTMLNEDEVKNVELRIDQLVDAGCQRSVLYFCLDQLSPSSEEIRAGFEWRGVDLEGSGEYTRQKQKRPLATREDMALVASTAKAARLQIHRYQRELSLAAGASARALPRGFSTRVEDPEDTLLLLKSCLTWVAGLAESYTAPMETTLVKSKGLLYLTLYTSLIADRRSLRSPRVKSVTKDSRKASGDLRARRSTPAPGNVLAELASAVTGGTWSSTELKDKQDSFRKVHPNLHRILSRKLTELHEFESR